MAGCTSSISGNPTAAGSAVNSGGAPTPAGPSGSNSQSGRPSAPPASPSSSGSSSNAAQLRTADPCSFIAQNAFDSVASDVQGSVQMATYNLCEIGVSGKVSGKTASWTVNVDMASLYTSTSSLQQVFSTSFSTGQVNGTSVYEGSSPTYGCMRGYTLPGNTTTVLVRVLPVASGCPVADAGITSVIQTAKAGGEKALRLPAGSLAQADLCATFLSSAQRLLGSGAKGMPDGLHSCSWSVGTHTVDASLEASPWPPQSIAPGTTSVKLAGRPVVYSVNAAGGGAFAQASIDFGPAPVGSGDEDVLSVLSATRTGGTTTLKSGFLTFLTSLADSSLH
jgi:hypothetical protein